MLKVIHTENAPAAVGPYSQAIEGGNLIFVSGQVPLDPATKTLVDSDIKAATRQCLENAEAILKESGCTFNNVMKVTVLMDNMDDFAEMNEVYAEFFSEHKPARAAFEVARLPLGALVEIEMIAMK